MLNKLQHSDLTALSMLPMSDTTVISYILRFSSYVHHITNQTLEIHEKSILMHYPHPALC